MDARSKNHRNGTGQSQHWYKSGVIYEVHVRAFCDSTGDGAGDFVGLTQKLDYIKDLGVTAVWLLPFYPSPLRDDGYDIADYCNVHPMYGTLADFKQFLREAHRRGLRVITELVLNHTSDQHPWFQRARRAPPGSRWRNFYVWSDTQERYRDARIIFKDVELSNWTYDHVAQAYYWHRFFSHQPDLNWENPEVYEEMIKVVDFWLDLGVDGLRLDAVPYLFEREGTSCENLPETHACLKRFRAHVDAKYENRMLLGEANQWPEDAVAYFGQGRGDECHMAFHFPLMPRLFMAARMEDRTPIVEILEQTPPIPETAQWALFLRNHDELTLEMVTDEERDYMYRMYAHVHQARLNLGIRRRLAPLLGNDRKSIELLNALLFSLPGTPVLYYGDEIGLGDNYYLGDRDGVRTPMQWSSDKNAGFSRANPQSLYLPIILDPVYHYEACNVEAQLANPHSLLWWMRRLLALRKRWRALGEGKCEFLQPDNRKILSYILRFEEETILVVANLSRFVQAVELDLARFKSCMPVELFGHTEFPAITDRPYFLSLGPHAFYWFSLESRHARVAGKGPKPLHGEWPLLSAVGGWQKLLAGRNQSPIEALLPDYLRRQRWFAGGDKIIKSTTLRESMAVRLSKDGLAWLLLVGVEYVQGDPEVYSLPLACAAGAEAARLRRENPEKIIAELATTSPRTSGVLFDAMEHDPFCAALLGLVQRQRRLRSAHGQIVSGRLPGAGRLNGSSRRIKVTSRFNQGNSSIVCGNKIILKLFRRLEDGIHPDLEVSRVLQRNAFLHCRQLAGSLDYVREGLPNMTLAIAHAFVPGAKSGLEFTIDALGRYYDRVVTWLADDRLIAPALPDSARLLDFALLPPMQERIGTFLESARVIGQRLAEFHLAMAADTQDPAFAPEPFTPHYQRSQLQSMLVPAAQNLQLLRRQLKSLPSDVAGLAKEVLAVESRLAKVFRELFAERISAQRIRIHGDCHLGHVLWTDKNFIFIDFGGDLAKPISERTIKRSPLRDVARLVRSFHFAAHESLWQHVETGRVAPEDLPRFEPWVRYWNRGVSLAFFQGYFALLKKTGLLPDEPARLEQMLRAYLLNQTIQELGRELAQGGERVRIPLMALLRLASSQPNGK